MNDLGTSSHCLPVCKNLRHVKLYVSYLFESLTVKEYYFWECLKMAICQYDEDYFPVLTKEYFIL